jgi:hypothetical protein
VQRSNRPGRAATLAAALISLGVMVWARIPQHQRKLLLMQVTDRLRRAAARAAAGEGHAGMGDELAGRDPGPKYRAAFHLSRARDAFGRALEGMQP